MKDTIAKLMAEIAEIKNARNAQPPATVTIEAMEVPMAESSDESRPQKKRTIAREQENATKNEEHAPVRAIIYRQPMKTTMAARGLPIPLRERRRLWEERTSSRVPPNQGAATGTTALTDPPAEPTPAVFHDIPPPEF
ncbi:hypothetical protein HPB52_015972 [Rhipicephalus sanguineus]|uniref:Uncharacterized protein n=1 Tax=Rhipicephalus sanguineus TaxID=34632 RepID=A0A9D4Q0V9_RHISA|nr:hypothetical protein HPB52_015972 [Rhipicephalus sanguineus]